MTVNVVFKRSEAALPYEPDKWNDDSIVGNRNCYTYAFNLHSKEKGKGEHDSYLMLTKYDEYDKENNSMDNSSGIGYYNYAEV